MCTHRYVRHGLRGQLGSGALRFIVDDFIIIIAAVISSPYLGHAIALQTRS